MALIKTYNPLKKNLLLILHCFLYSYSKIVQSECFIYWIQNLDWLFSKYRNCSLKFLICLTLGFYRNFCLPSLFACVCVCTALAFFFNSKKYSCNSPLVIKPPFVQWNKRPYKRGAVQQYFTISEPKIRSSHTDPRQVLGSIHDKLYHTAGLTLQGNSGEEITLWRLTSLSHWSKAKFKSAHFSMLSSTSPCVLPERVVTSPSNLKVLRALLFKTHHLHFQVPLGT